MSDAYDPYDPVPQETPPGTKLGYAFLGGLAVITAIVLIVVAVRKNAASKPLVATGQAERRAAPAPQRPAEPWAAQRAQRPAVDEVDSFLRHLEDREREEEIKRVVIIVLLVLYLVLVILLMAWVAKDCRNRGIDGGAVWVFVIFLTGVVGLLVYLASRPHGMLTTCAHCQNRRLNYAKTCPHCGRE